MCGHLKFKFAPGGSTLVHKHNHKEDAILLVPKFKRCSSKDSWLKWIYACVHAVFISYSS